jgi:hypothetical protein
LILGSSLVLLAVSIILGESITKAGMTLAQGYGGNYGGYGGGGSYGGMRGAGGNATGGAGSGGYIGAIQANIHQNMLYGNKEVLRDDVDYEDYLLQKRSAFAYQMQQNEQAEEKLRAYAEKRLKALSRPKPALTASEQAEAHDLVDWLKKDAEQRANNHAWLNRQDQSLAYLEQDQMVSVKNQRNALHNMYEDAITVEDQYKWNKQMQLARLHLQQNREGAVSWGRPPQDGLSNLRGVGYGGYGYGFGRRWGY